jgi:cytidylate kinase
MAGLEVRTQTLMEREHLEHDEAETYVEELERARVSFFRKFFKVHPNEPTLYHMMLNMDKMQPKTAAKVIVHAAGDLAS